MKPGTKLKSAVCETEVMVIKGSDAVVHCGGQPMSESPERTPDALDAAFSEGTKVGKRYVDDGGAVELLCVKAGKGSLSMAGNPLRIKDSKPLPSSD
ncbi:MAG: hypothetical protein CMK83_01715 [Pseudomonadales bacterium]|nr:hypothetical protein [Pseudomonadales bacterium]MEC8810077.1 hypothetical protein [Pseudomonadota bacterium]TNC87890.1 MAG: hypothetical protein CSH49_14030 [Alcanivorax sp.]HBO93070.1 hypothetical protein [Gammaproteobacteria bacterium]MAQ22912.1 hypothetical protein [Pseudomonadales bacterium]|tara:strand:- start:42 stop:332 length:291 start_codon:yes stop_codon:yes gene_type:complete